MNSAPYFLYPEIQITMDKILVIEDKPDLRENTMEILELAGYLVLTAADGMEGIAMAIEHLPALILCDVKMPLASGYEVFKRLKAHPTTSNIPFVFFTSSVEKREVQIATDLGANGYVCKPFEVSELLNIIERCLGESHAKFSEK